MSTTGKLWAILKRVKLKMDKSGFEIFMLNPYWKRIYEQAPSEELREYYRVMFNTSLFLYGEDAKRYPERELLKTIMLSRDDVVYLLDHAGMAVAKIKYSRILAELDDREKDSCSNIPAVYLQGEERNPWYREKTVQGTDLNLSFE